MIWIVGGKFGPLGRECRIDMEDKKEKMNKLILNPNPVPPSSLSRVFRE